MDLFLCEHCGEQIGVYEPLVICAEESARTTSRAAEPDLRADDGDGYCHRDCYAAWEDEQAGGQVAASHS
jgi:hypothetical protein